MNTLFESRSALYWSAMNEYYRYFLLTSPANILKYIMCFVVAGGAVAEMIFLRDILNTANDIFLMVLCVVVALLVIVVSFTRYFSLKKTFARRDSETTHRERVSRVTEDRVVTTTDTGDESSARIEDIKFVYIGKTTLFVQTKGALVHMFPKDSFTAGDACEMVEFMRLKGIKIK